MITIFAGENVFVRKTEVDKLVQTFMAEHGEFGLERLDGEEVEYDRIRESLESLPFLASKKLVVLRTPGASKQFLENAETLLGNLPDSTDVIIIEPKLDKRLSYYKFLKKQPGFHELDNVDESGLTNWLVQQAKGRDGTLSSSDARYLVERVGANQQMLANELDKLLNYNSAVTRSTIDLLVEPNPQSTIFELLDAALAGKTKRALELYQEQRAQKVEPQQILALVGWQLHAMALVKTAGDRDPATIAKEAKLNPFVVRKTQGIVRNMSLAELKKLIHETLELDVRLKSENIDADEALQNLIISLK